MEPEGTQPKTVNNIVALEQARFWEAYWADPNDYQLRNQLAEMNRRLIGWMFKKLGRRLDELSVELREEVEQEAFLGLLHAVELFDPLKGFTFATYAPHWIHQAIDRYLKNARNPVRIPVHIGDAAGHFWKAEKAFFKQEGRMPTDEELATFLGFPIEAVTEIRKLVTPIGVISINQHVHHNADKCEVGDLFADPNAADPFEEVAKFEVPEGVDLARLKRAFEAAPERSKEMLILSARDHTLEEIGQQYGVSRERVRQVIKRTIEDIRVALGIDPELPIRSIRYADKIQESETVVIHGVSISGFVQRIKTVEEEVRVYGRAKLRLPSSVHIRTRRRQRSTTYTPRTTGGAGRKGKAPKVRKSIIVRVVSTKSLPPAYSTIRLMETDLNQPAKPNRLLVSEDEFAIAEVAWRRLSYGKWRYLDFELVAEEVKLPLNKIHLVSCALIAKGVIQQDRPGMYQQGWSHLAIRRLGEEQLEIDLQLTPDQQPTLSEALASTADVSTLSPAEIDAEIAELERAQGEIASRIQTLKEMGDSEPQPHISDQVG